MKKFDVGARVLFEREGKFHRGRVTEALPKKRRVVTDTRKQFTVWVGHLRPSPDRVLILEARLDPSPWSTRFYAEMLERWLSAYRVRVFRERVHSRADLLGFLKRAARQKTTRFVHIMAHGLRPAGKLGTSLQLTLERIDLLEDAEMFSGLDGKILIFSCCNVGADAKAMAAVKEASGAAAIIAYRVPVEDSYTNLHETLIYDRLLNTTRLPETVAKDVSDALYGLGIRPGDVHVKKSALVVY